MSANATDLQGLADRIGEKLSPIHRGAIWIGPKTLAIFGNDGFGKGERSKRTAERMRAWLIYRDWNPSAIMTDAEDYSWVIVAECSGRERDREQADRRTWKLWNDACGGGKPDTFHQAQANLEIENIGGGYTDATLSTPRKGKGGPVRGNLLVNTHFLRSAEGGEEVHVLLGGVPFPAKIPPTVPETSTEESDTAQSASARGWELAVLSENVGDPRSESHDDATAFLAAGSPLMVRDTGERHEVTGRRVLAPIPDPQPL